MPVAVIDFETTGSSPGQGARATEIAAVLVDDGRIVGHWSSLMNSGARVPPFIENGEVLRVDTRTGEYIERAK